MSKEEKHEYKFGRWKMGPAMASPVAGPVEIEKADLLIVSTGLNGKNQVRLGTITSLQRMLVQMETQRCQWKSAWESTT